MSNSIYLNNLMIEVGETVKNLSLTLTSTHQIKLNGLPLISTTRLYKAKLLAYTSPQIALESVFHSHLRPWALIRKGRSDALLFVA